MMTQTAATPAVPANSNRASAGYTYDVLLAMLVGLDACELYYAETARQSHAATIGHRHNHVPEHAGRILAAAERLRSYGLRVRVSKYCGRPDSITVYGPKSGGSEGRYSA